MGHSKSKDALDESVRDPHRPPQRLDGLLDFLQEEYKHKFGIFCDDSKALFNMWKEHVSSSYRQQRESRAALMKSLNQSPSAKFSQMQDAASPTFQNKSMITK